jgi:hypothetical protein
MTSMLALTSRDERVPDGLLGPTGFSVKRAPHREQAAPEHWVEPGTSHCYPLPYGAYRRAREAQEKPPARHRALGPDIDHYLWRHRQLVDDVDVLFIVREGTPPRIRRIIAEILAAIRRGHPANDAIRHVSRRFGLRPGRARALITPCIGFEAQSCLEELSPSSGVRTD